MFGIAPNVQANSEVLLRLPVPLVVVVPLVVAGEPPNARDAKNKPVRV